MKALSPILGRTTEVVPTDWSVGQWKIVRCLETGLIYLQNPPGYEALQDEFAWERTSATETQRRRQKEPVRQYLSDKLKAVQQRLRHKQPKLFRLLNESIGQSEVGQPIRVLDVGCGSGHLLSKFQQQSDAEQRTIVPMGIEISPVLAASAGASFEAFGGTVHQGPAIEGLEQFEESSLDAIIMCSYLEHEVRPLDVLVAARRVLKPSGVVVLKVPNFSCWNRHLRGKRWCGFRFPDHVNYFTPATMRILADAAGLAWKRQKPTDRSVLSDNMYAVLARPAANEQAIPAARAA